jgi:hypothetical protein
MKKSKIIAILVMLSSLLLLLLLSFETKPEKPHTGKMIEPPNNSSILWYYDFANAELKFDSLILR